MNDDSPVKDENRSAAQRSIAGVWRWLVRRVRCLWLALSSDRAARFATVLQLLVVPVSLYFIWSQLEQQGKSMELQTNLTRAANTQALANMVAPMNMELAKNSELIDLMIRGSKGFRPTKNRAVEEEQYTTILATYLIFYENVYEQHEKQLLDDDVYAGWKDDLKTFVDEEALERYWDSWKSSYRTRFGDEVTELVADKRRRLHLVP